MTLPFFFTLASWKLLGVAGYGFMIWCYQMAFTGSIYATVMPLLKFFADMPVRRYHYAVALMAMLLCVHTLAQLIRVGELDFITIMLDFMIPPGLILGSLWLRAQMKKKKEAGSQTA